jgi:hypothetical protein
MQAEKEQNRESIFTTRFIISAELVDCGKGPISSPMEGRNGLHKRLGVVREEPPKPRGGGNKVLLLTREFIPDHYISRR